jgi:hypothetical protein
MDNSASQYLANLDARRRVCEHCEATFNPGRSDQRFCTDLCRLRRWRMRKSTPSPCTEAGQQRLAALGANLDRLQAQITELRQLNAALHDALATCDCAESSIDTQAVERPDDHPHM